MNRSRQETLAFVNIDNEYPVEWKKYLGGPSSMSWIRQWRSANIGDVHWENRHADTASAALMSVLMTSDKWARWFIMGFGVNQD
jgi:hypothetical protein